MKRMKRKKLKLDIRKVGLIVKVHHQEATELARKVTSMLLDCEYLVYFSQESSSAARKIARELKVDLKSPRSKIKVTDRRKLVSAVDIAVVLGGDGTFLSIARMMGHKSIPLVGVNLGQLGFLTEIKKDEAIEALRKVLSKGELNISERALLDVALKRGKKIIRRAVVVNDAVISKGAIARIIGIDVSVDGHKVATVRADGLMVSTPTGSTAYSMAAGGPIVAPDVPAFLITPICPHSLTQRPIVVSDHSTVEMCLNHRPGQVILTLDGQDAIELKEGDTIVVSRFDKHPLRIVSSPMRDYFSVLREKFKFGMRV